MQLGTRWAAGSEPPASVPAALRPGIADAEARSVAGGTLSLQTGALNLLRGTWTLTWLEGRPIAELDTGWEVSRTASGDVVVRPFED
ncbi:MAG: hypothetical protein B7X41_05975 [Microbacterium sp. 14-71-5]|nr:hypothetical protein [Microbacterium sp. 13-71-7]OZB79983.1 MAG: hypothetical protein B7X32_20255 [Microbacterium sp. 13-71-7]OZB88848.1 MAG: hypothetical protein B7X41_05975 [Microbacterium sp. 14-71-5]